MTILGQFFTEDINLQNFIFDHVLNKGQLLLEPSFGHGHLLKKFKEFDENYPMDLFEIDNNLKPIIKLNENQTVVYDDFLKRSTCSKKYKTIIGNPPYIKKKGLKNIYIRFIEICYDLLDPLEGELIFIVPSDFIRKTSSSEIITRMASNGSFTHFYRPNRENLFKDASIDIMVFRYLKNSKIYSNNCIIYNKYPLTGLGLVQETYINIDNGIITFQKIENLENQENQDNQTLNKKTVKISDLFDIYVGFVSGLDSVFKQPFGNTLVLTKKDQLDLFIMIDKYPSNDTKINNHLLENKEDLLQRRIKKFTEKNWFEWSLRNKKAIDLALNKDCIFINTITRSNEVAFIDKVKYFGPSLICLVPKTKEQTKEQINKIVLFLNSPSFRENYTYAGRFKIGHREIQNIRITL